jgi:hypothetical protein
MAPIEGDLPTAPQQGSEALLLQRAKLVAAQARRPLQERFPERILTKDPCWIRLIEVPRCHARPISHVVVQHLDKSIGVQRGQRII